MSSDIEIYLYSNCSSCRDADAILKKSNLTVERRDLFKDPLKTDEIATLFRRINVTASEMISTRSRPFRELKLAAQHLSDEELIELMANHPALIRRPVILSSE